MMMMMMMMMMMITMMMRRKRKIIITVFIIIMIIKNNIVINHYHIIIIIVIIIFIYRNRSTTNDSSGQRPMNFAKTSNEYYLFQDLSRRKVYFDTFVIGDAIVSVFIETIYNINGHVLYGVLTSNFALWSITEYIAPQWACQILNIWYFSRVYLFPHWRAHCFLLRCFILFWITKTFLGHLRDILFTFLHQWVIWYNWMYSPCHGSTTWFSGISSAIGKIFSDLRGLIQIIA